MLPVNLAFLHLPSCEKKKERKKMEKIVSLHVLRAGGWHDNLGFAKAARLSGKAAIFVIVAVSIKKHLKTRNKAACYSGRCWDDAAGV